MGHVLTLQRKVVTPPERAKYFERLRAKLAHYTAAGCRFWVFEEAALPGAFVEFYEAKDAATLAAAHASAPEQILNPSRVYSEVELH